MPILANARRERFCQEIAGGSDNSKAYVKAGYKPGNAQSIRSQAYSLTKTPEVKARILELLGKRAGKVAGKYEFSRDDLTEMYLADRVLARNSGQVAAAIKAVDSLARLYGFWIDKSISVNVYAEMTNDQLNAELRRLDARIVEIEASESSGGG